MARDQEKQEQTLEQFLVSTPKPAPERLATLNRYADPIAEYGDWADDGEWPPQTLRHI